MALDFILFQPPHCVYDWFGTEAIFELFYFIAHKLLYDSFNLQKQIIWGFHYTYQKII